jgi:hypothetical protein
MVIDRVRFYYEGGNYIYDDAEELVGTAAATE